MQTKAIEGCLSRHGFFPSPRQGFLGFSDESGHRCDVFQWGGSSERICEQAAMHGIPRSYLVFELSEYAHRVRIPLVEGNDRSIPARRVNEVISEVEAIVIPRLHGSDLPLAERNMLGARMYPAQE